MNIRRILLELLPLSPLSIAGRAFAEFLQLRCLNALLLGALEIRLRPLPHHRDAKHRAIEPADSQLRARQTRWYGRLRDVEHRLRDEADAFELLGRRFETCGDIAGLAEKLQRGAA